MNLKKIEIYGFKSFSDKLTMQFDYPVTGVVGPNGCGKSNVVDAVRWVLGEQSAKALRGKVMQDLIFSGTEQRKSMSYCEVSLYLDNIDRIFSLDVEEIIISRKLYRNNESEYFINRKPALLKNVSDLLREAGLGLDGYSIVGQGRMDAVLNAKPEDRRAIFEEALGITKYRVRKLETERKIEKTRLNISQLALALEEMERQLGPLKKQAENAKKYLELAERLKYHELNTYIYTYDNSSQKKAALAHIIQDMQKERQDIFDAYQIAQKKYEEILALINGVDQTLTSLRDEQLKLSVKIERRSGEAKLIKERLGYLKKSNQDLAEQIESAKALIQRMGKNIEDATKEQEAKNAEYENISKLLNESSERIISFSDKLVAYQSKVDAAQKRVMQIMGDISNKRSVLSAFTSEKNTRLSRLERINRDIDEINKKIQNLSLRQSEEIDELIEGNYAKISAEKLANDVEGYVAAIESLLPRVVLGEATLEKVRNLLDEVGQGVIRELRSTKTFEHQNWQQNLTLMSVLKERFSKYAALHDNERKQLEKLEAEKGTLVARLQVIEETITKAQQEIKTLEKEKEKAALNVAENQKEYNKIKSEKDAAQESLTAIKLKTAALKSNIAIGENAIRGYRNSISKAKTEIEQKTAQIARNDEIVQNLEIQAAAFGDDKDEKERLNEISQRLSMEKEEKSKLLLKLTEADKKRTQLSDDLRRLDQSLAKEEYNLRKIDDDLNALQDKIFIDYNHTYSSAMEFKDENYDLSRSTEEISRLRSQIAKLHYVNPNAVEEYAETLKRYETKTAQIEDLQKAEKDLEKVLVDVTKEIKERFDVGFRQISENFGVVFKELFGGGHARMTLDRDPEKNELDYGVEIEAQPPGKKLQNISLLSGGERTLTAAAILFAILKLRPMPFCVLDEIEAALDDANAQRIAEYIKNFSKKTQFVVITHKKPTMEACDMLYGVTMEEKGVSKMVSVQLTEAIKSAV